MTHRIPIFRPSMPPVESVLSFLQQIDRGRVYSNNGPILAAYKEELSAYLGVPTERLVILSSATLCLQGLAELSEKKNWIVPDFTFAASGLAVLNAGRQLTLVDVEETSWQLSRTEVDKKLTSFSGVMPVMPFGADVDLQDWAGYQDLIIDAAASLGAEISGLETLGAKSAVVFSVHATKVFPAGEGGVAVCGSESLARRLTQWGNFGMSEDRVSKFVGTNGKMTEFVAAYGLKSLIKREKESLQWSAQRGRARAIEKRLAIESPVIASKGINPYWILTMPDEGGVTKLKRICESEGIETRSWWPSELSAMPAFSGMKAGPNRVAKLLAKTTVGLPFRLDQTEEEFARIELALEKALP